MNNAEVLKKGFAKGLKLIEETLIASLVDAAYKLLVQAESNKEYHNLTGYTLTSYMVGVYAGGSLRRIVTMYDADTDIDRPKRGKLYRCNGRGVVYVEDYDSGRRVHIRKSNLIETDRDYGENTSRNFLREHKVGKDKIGLVSSVHGISQARVLEWGAIAFSDIYTCTYTNIVTNKNIVRALKESLESRKET